jgi:large subunit ribosomal protein L7/L12
VSLTRDEVIRYLDGLSGAELGQLIDDVQRRLGLPVFAAPEPRRIIAGAIPLIDEYSVALLGHGGDKLLVIKAVRELEGLRIGLAEAKALVESAPVVLREGLSHEEAQDIARKLARAGAEVRVEAR